MVSYNYLIKLAFRNVFQNKRRTLLTAIVIMVSVSLFLFMFSYIKGVRDGIVEDSIKLTGHVSVQHPEYGLKERMLSLSVPVRNYSDIRGGILSIPFVSIAAGRIKFGGLIDFEENNENGIGLAIDPSAEKDILGIQNTIVSGRGFSEGSEGKNEIIVGIKLAASLDIQPGDTVTVISRTAYNSLTAENLRVAGVVDLLSGVMNRLFYIHLETAQYLLDMENSVTEIAVYLEDDYDENVLKRTIEDLPDISNTYSVMTWLDKGILKDYLPMLDTGNFIVILIFGMIAAFGIINTMLMAVFERTKEIGVLTAFGMKKREVLLVFLFEALLIGCIGSLSGVAVGGYWAIFLETHGFTMGSITEGLSVPIRTTIYADFQWLHAFTAFCLGLGMSVGAALFPAVKAARMQPTDALKTY